MKPHQTLPIDQNAPLGVGLQRGVLPAAHDSQKELLEPEATIAREACAEMQPMPLNGADALLVADLCEIIGEAHAQAKEWRKCANAHRMACWYYKQHFAGR